MKVYKGQKRDGGREEKEKDRIQVNIKVSRNEKNTQDRQIP